MQINIREVRSRIPPTLPWLWEALHLSAAKPHRNSSSAASEYLGKRQYFYTATKTFYICTNGISYMSQDLES